MSIKNLGIYKDVYHKMMQFIGIIDTEGRLLDANENALAFIGCDIDQVVGQYFWDTPWWTHNPRMQQMLKEGIQRAAQGHVVRFEATNADASGHPIDIDFSITPVFNNLGTVEYLIPEGRDISAIRQVTNRLEASEKRYRDLFEKNTDPCFILKKGIFIECNHAAIKMLYYKNKDDFYAIPPTNLSPEFQPNGEKSVHKANRMLEIASEKGSHRFEWVHRRVDGGLLQVEVTLTRLEIEGEEVFYTVWRDISEYQRILDELKRSENKFRSLNNHLEQLVAERTQALEESMATLLKTQNSLIESEKMASLGELVAGISHEINTPIGVGITGITYINKLIADMILDIKNNTLSKSKFSHYVQDIESAGQGVFRNLDTASNLIHSFKDIAVDRTNDQLRKINLYEYLDEIVHSLRSELKRNNCSVELLISHDLAFDTYPGAISHIFTNLIVNSIKHGLQETKQPAITIIAFRNPEGITLTYKDNGVGVTEDIAKKMFDPFFTTKRNSGSSGLGMSIVYNLVVQKLKGKIEVCPTCNKGFELNIDLPLLSRQDLIDM